MTPSRFTRAKFAVGAVAASLMWAGTATAFDDFWSGNVSTEWNNAGNWFAPAGGTGFVPQVAGGFNLRAIIGTDNPNGALDTTLGNSAVISGPLPTANQTIGGLYLGLRELDYATSPPEFANEPAPDPGTLVGALTINGGVLNSVSTSQAGIGADGRIVVGADGRGYLTMNGGTLTGVSLDVGGEEITTGGGTSLVDLRGNSTLTVNGATNLTRRLRIEGSGVNFSSASQVTFAASNTYTAAITDPGAHSPIRVTTLGQVASLGGTLNVEFSGAAATRDPITSLGSSWRLVQAATPDVTALSGNFSSVNITGLAPGSEAPLGAQYTLRKSTDGTNANLDLSYEAVLILTVNRDTGELSVRNPYGGDIEIDHYSISSARGSMLNTYNGLGVTTPGAGDWVKPLGNNVNVISEVKVPDSTPPITNDDAYDLTSVPSVSLGTGAGAGFDREGVAANIANFGQDGEDLIFTYGGPATGDVTFRGHIEYIGSKFENNLVLRVNPSTGEATLKNDSLETLVFDGFEISSTDAALSDSGFTAITGGTGTWMTDAEGTTGLTQVNFDGSSTLTPGQEVSIGDISALVDPFTSAAAQDGLSMRFILAEGLESTPVGGDYNGDGEVNAADYTVFRDNENTSFALTNENPAALTPGFVDQEDYDYWVAQFGLEGGFLPETEFRVGSIFFDATLGASTAIPEPSAGVLMGACMAALGLRRRKSYAVETRNKQSEAGGGTQMKTRIPTCLFVAVALAVVAASRSASAVTGGIPLVNFDMELPASGDEKSFAYEENGTPIPDAIPGWVFTGGAGGVGETNGVGVEDFGHEERFGDSGTESSGNPIYGREMLLSTNDGLAYQIAAGHTIVNPAVNQQYKISFDASAIFTIDVNEVGVDMGHQLSVRVFAGAFPGTTITTLDVNPEGGFQHYEILIPRDDPSLSGVLGQSLGIEFDTTSREFNALVDKSWSGIDNVVMELTGVIPGDLNGDGFVDANDASQMLANMQANSPFEADGDLTNDNVVNLNDFRVLKGLIAAASSANSTGGIGHTVPEPSSAMLVLFGLFLTAAACFGRQVSLRRAPLVAVAVMAAGLSATTESKAELLVYEPFLIGANPAAGEYVQTTYTTDDPPVPVNPLAGQNPATTPTSFFNGPWVLGTAGQAVQPTSLSYLGTPSLGGSVGGGEINSEGRTTRLFNTNWDANTNGTFYIGLQVNFGDTVNTDMGYRAIELYPPNVAPAENRVGDIGYNEFFSTFGALQQEPDTAQMQFNIDGNQQIISSAPASFNDDGLNHLLVLKFEFSTEAASDSVSLYLDPRSPIEPSFPSVIVENIDFELGSFGAASFGGGGATTTLDEIRIATTYVEALPPDLPIPGDVNGDGFVDLLDYDIILANINQPGGEALSEGDVNGDGQTTTADFRFWKERRTDLAGGGTSTGGLVPEPATGVVLMMAFLMSVGAGSRASRA